MRIFGRVAEYVRILVGHRLTKANQTNPQIQPPFPLDAYFWVGKGSVKSQDGQAVAVAAALLRQDWTTVVITLPRDLTVFDIDYLSVRHKNSSEDFDHVLIDSAGLNVPPSPAMIHLNLQQVSSIGTPGRKLGQCYNGSHQFL